MKLKYEIDALPIKLTKEMESINERHRILYYNDYVEVELFDIRESNGFYERRRQEIDEEGVKKDVWDVDVDFSIMDIETVISNHDPYTPFITEEKQRMLDIEMIIADMLGV